jgi:Rrf2 family protein
MKLSTKSTYGLRAMLNVAVNDGKEAVSSADIAKREGISIAYLEQLLKRLRRNGLIESIRGPKGGYVLSKNASEITVADIVRTLEGSIYPVDCATRGTDGDSCKRGKSCVPKLVWHKLAKAINDCLESVTLEDLCDEAAKIGRRRI